MGKIRVTPLLANDIAALLRMAEEIGATVRVTDGGKTVYIQLGVGNESNRNGSRTPEIKRV